MTTKRQGRYGSRSPRTMDLEKMLKETLQTLGLKSLQEAAHMSLSGSLHTGKIARGYGMN